VTLWRSPQRRHIPSSPNGVGPYRTDLSEGRNDTADPIPPWRHLGGVRSAADGLPARYPRRASDIGRRVCAKSHAGS
jgi:hypothetical protein